MSEQEPRHYWQVPEELVTEAWAEKRRLASALRELAALCVTTDAPAAELAAATRGVSAALEVLREHPQRTFQEAFPDCRGLDELAQFTDRATLVGQCNPYAPPMKLSFADGVAVATLVFGPIFEGAPGFVHGGLVAAAFDQLLGYLQVRREAPSLTRVLTVHYKKPTPFQTELTIEGRFERCEGRKHYLSARLFARGEVTAEAEGVFVTLGSEAFLKLFEAVRQDL